MFVQYFFNSFIYNIIKSLLLLHSKAVKEAMADMHVQQAIFQRLANMDQQVGSEQTKSQYSSAFMIHLILKCVPIVLYIIRSILRNKISNMLMIELILISVVVDFWFTKNITGRRMVGLRWGFDEDQYGVQRFKVQSRVNQEYVNQLSSKLFWVVLAIYCIIPLLLIFIAIFKSNTVSRIRLDDVLICVAIFLGGAVNLFFYWKASRTSGHKRAELTHKFDRNFMSKLGGASMIAYS